MRYLIIISSLLFIGCAPEVVTLKVVEWECAEYKTRPIYTNSTSADVNNKECVAWVKNTH